MVSGQKIKQENGCISRNIRELRLERGMKPTELVRGVQLLGADMTREALVKIERGDQHIRVSQLRAIREVLGVGYDELLK